MALPVSRAQFKEYIKRRLGEPVITVNVTDDQLEERVDDALAFFQDYHFGGSERVYLKHRLSYSNMVFTTATTGTFANGEYAKGATSNVTVMIHTQTSNNTVEYNYLRAEPTEYLQVGEQIIGAKSNASGTIQSMTLGDWDSHYVPISNLVMSIYRVLPMDGFAVDRGTGLFSWNYQFLMNDLSWLSSSSVISYYLTRSHMEMLNDLFIGDPAIRFNRHVNKLYLDVDWNEDLKPGDFLVVEAMRILDPAEYPRLWQDRFFRDYATALTKKQWGANLMKYDGVQMPGGVTLNGRAIYDEGVREVEKIEETVQDKYELPPEFFVG